MLMHRAFRDGRKVFVSRPANHFPLHEDATLSLLFAGGIGVTPMITMAHRLHLLGKPFDLHYSAASRSTAGFLQDLNEAAWNERIRYHFKDEGQRADLRALIPAYQTGYHVYTCGAVRYMDGVFEAATEQGWPEEAMHREFFSVPEAPDWVNLPFTLKLAKSGRSFAVPAERNATDVLAEAGFVIDTKCSDGICGVCATRYLPAESGEVEHRDYVLSAKDREQRVILCCARTKAAGAELVVDL